MSKASGSIDLKSLKVAGEPNKYITKISGDGIKIHDSQNQNNNYIQLTSDGMKVYKNSNMCFEASATELKASLTEAKDVFTVGYGSAIANKTDTQILNSTSGVLDLNVIPLNTNFNLTFTVFFVGYSVTLGQSTTFENKKLFPSDGFAWNSIQAGVWREAAGYSGELLPSGSMEIVIGQPTPGEKQINYNITITGTGLTFDYATITAVWEESAAVKDQVFLTFGSREDGISKGLFSSAMGLKVAAIGDYSHAEGYHTIASGNYSHTIGFNTQAIGDYSYASGYGTKATIDYQTVFGKYNLEDSEAMFIVGNGTDDNNRSNLMTIGNNYVNIGGNNSSNISIGLNGISAYKSDGAPYFQIGLQDATIAQKATASVTFGRGLSGFGVYLAQDSEFSQLYNNLEEGETFDVSFISKIHWYRDATGQDGYNSHGYTVTLTKGTPFSWTTPNSQTTVVYSVTYVPSNNGKVSVSFSDAYWDNYYPSSVWWLRDTCSLKFTCLVNTPGPSYSFGINTDVSKKLGFAIGNGTIPSDTGFACGKYNISDTNNNYVLIIGNGTSSTPSNALTVDWNGNIDAAGGIIAGGNINTTGNVTATGTINAANGAFTVNSSGNIVTSGNITTLNHSSPIGTVISKVGATDYTTNVSSGTETWKSIGYIEVTVGRYILFARARFSPTSSGAHYSDINVSTTSASNSNRDRRYGASNYVNQHSYSTWVNITESNVDENGLCKIYLNGYSTVAGEWVRDNANAFYLAAMRIM